MVNLGAKLSFKPPILSTKRLYVEPEPPMRFESIPIDLIIDSYMYKDRWTGYATIWGNAEVGQAFSIGNSNRRLDFSKFTLHRHNNPTGLISSAIHHCIGIPGINGNSNDSLFIARSKTIDITTLQLGERFEGKFIFDPPVQLNANTNYVILVRLSGGDSSNYLVGGVDVSILQHYGNVVIHDVSGWKYYTQYDDYFIVGTNDTKIVRI